MMMLTDVKCESKNHGKCENLATWQCEFCRKHFCETEGAADGFHGCDDCWAALSQKKTAPESD